MVFDSPAREAFQNQPKKMNTLSKYLVLITFCTLCVVSSQLTGQENEYRSIPIDDIWAANTVNFSLETVGDQQFVAYYDSNRMMTVASRSLNSDTWTKATLDSRLLWDSHNSVTLGIDKMGYIHVSGNMHNHPLCYYRSSDPYDVTTLKRIDFMVGYEETEVTYPKFFYTKTGDLLYSYRTGSSGDGNIHVNRYLPQKDLWQRHLDQPLFEGREADGSTRNAYHQYTYDSEGNLHFAWIWRWTPMVETSHNICYAVTPDLINWFDAAGNSISFPFSPDSPDTMVDPIPSKGGSHNGRVKLAIDSEKNPIIGYVKYDENGLTQLYLSRFENGSWTPKQISDWDFRWKFHGGGDTMTFGGSFQIQGLSPEGLLVIDWKTENGESGQYIVDAKTLEHSDKSHTLAPPVPAGIREQRTEYENFTVSTTLDAGKASNGKRYALRWESAQRTHEWRESGPQPEGPITPLELLEY